MGHSEGGRGRPVFTRLRADDPNHQIIDRLFSLMDSFKGRFLEVATEHDLTMPLAHLLLNLDEPLAMREVAANMGYDASHITSLVDQLEQRGLVDRCADPHDRRVKRIVVTESGRALRSHFEDRLLATMLPFDQLSDEQRRQFVGLLELITAAPVPSGAPARGEGAGTARDQAAQATAVAT